MYVADSLQKWGIISLIVLYSLYPRETCPVRNLLAIGIAVVSRSVCIEVCLLRFHLPQVTRSRGPRSSAGGKRPVARLSWKVFEARWHTWPLTCVPCICLAHASPVSHTLAIRQQAVCPPYCATSRCRPEADSSSFISTPCGPCRSSQQPPQLHPRLPFWNRRWPTKLIRKT